MGGGTVTVHYTGHFGRSLYQVVVYDHGVGDQPPLTLFLGPSGKALLDVGLVVAAGTKPRRLNLDGRHRQQDKHRIFLSLTHLPCPLQVDLQEHIASSRRVRDGGPVEVSEEFGPFEEAVLGHSGFEGGTVDEDVGIVGLARAADCGSSTSD